MLNFGLKSNSTSLPSLFTTKFISFPFDALIIFVISVDEVTSCPFTSLISSPTLIPTAWAGALSTNVPTFVVGTPIIKNNTTYNPIHPRKLKNGPAKIILALCNTVFSANEPSFTSTSFSL